ncbi:MAG: hypothetical protein COV67_12390 [Nitrospinae bacterium CG11_big_fil_rev_8_21_14_0_20_56_8]|nr:MAG: hypothetical protein COV67_12390 [Nitrospinae bacterium CG11_big_fil_rev_8_21_14_0_20_56_8]
MVNEGGRIQVSGKFLCCVGKFARKAIQNGFRDQPLPYGVNFPKFKLLRYILTHFPRGGTVFCDYLG